MLTVCSEGAGAVTVFTAEDKVAFKETETHRTIIISLDGATVNGQPVDALPPAYADLVPEDHLIKPIAQLLGRRWTEYMKQVR